MSFSERGNTIVVDELKRCFNFVKQFCKMKTFKYPMLYPSGGEYQNNLVFFKSATVIGSYCRRFDDCHFDC